MITGLFYSRTINHVQKEVLLTQEVSGVYTSPFSDTEELKMALRARKVSGAFETGPRSCVWIFLTLLHKLLPQATFPRHDDRMVISQTYSFSSFAQQS